MSLACLRRNAPGSFADQFQNALEGTQKAPVLIKI